MNQEELKQRLVELLDELYKREIIVSFEQIAETFIANGVTIRECGEWFLSIHHPCGVDYGRPHLVCSKCGNIEWEFKSPCPHCGADMRGVKDASSE